MYKFSAMCSIIVFALLTNSMASSKVSISAEIHPISWVTYSYSNRIVSDPPGRIGLRINPSDLVTFDVGFGMSYNSGNKKDATTSETPSFSNYKFDIGIAPSLAKGIHANLNLLLRYGLGIDKWYDSSYGNIVTYRSYIVKENSLFVGLEPSYTPSENISIYSTIGLNITFNPDSKRYNGSTFQTVHDGSTSINTNGCAIGIRYNF